MMENIRPIRTEDDYDWAIAEVTKYFENEPEIGSEDGNRFALLVDLIEAYENKHYPVKAPDPVSLIKLHLEFRGEKQAAFAELIGSKSRASEILRRKRHMTVSQIYELSSKWGLPADELVKPYHLTADESGSEAA
jgi:HTH-type transcriptional regulator/antitoxin HigA